MSTSSTRFERLREISLLTREVNTTAETEAREKLIRFLDSYQNPGPELPIVDSLCARFGLYPYMSDNSVRRLGDIEALAVEIHSPATLEDDNFTFHAQQQHVYQRLMDGSNVVLSAPTSFGKSIIMDALIASNKWSNIAIIVPTIALIDETRRRLTRFRGSYSIITHPTESFGERNIVIMTQERYLDLATPPAVDFFMIDEFYKLDPAGSSDQRSTLLNVAWRQLRRTGAQYYLTGPNVDALSLWLPDDLRATLVRTQFQTVVVDIDDRSGVSDAFQDLANLLPALLGPTLLFTASPPKAVRLAGFLESNLEPTIDGYARLVSDWIAEEFGESWTVAIALRAGIAIHTGPLPRSLQRIMTRLFNELLAPYLVCTSTLIEGVNTAAKNVVIMDKKIDGQLLDFFTFSNIRGRAGRAFRHFVGNVVTYVSPPTEEATEVDIPIESQSRRASNATLIQIPYPDMTDDARRRLSSIFEQDELSLATIRENRGIEPELQIAAASRLRLMSTAQLLTYSWSGPPSNEQARTVLRFAFENLLESTQKRGYNFERLWAQLQTVRQNPGDYRTIIETQSRYARQGRNYDDIVNEVLRFQRNWMTFTIPSMVRTLQTISSEVLVDAGLRPGNYEFLARDIQALYLPPGIADLEDYGLPISLALKLRPAGLRGSDLPELLDSLNLMLRDPRVTSSLSTIEQWILRDVQDGLEGIPMNRP